MREVIFRGKRVDNGDWVEGDLIWANYLPVQAFISSPKSDTTRLRKISTDGFSEWRAVQVIPETVGQYTGLKDKSGKMIFEGDKIKAYFLSNRSKQEFKVSFERGSFLFDNSYIKANERDLFSLEVIGNIHDNPELITKDE